MEFIITENQIEKLKLKILEQVKRFGFDYAKKIFGEKVLLQIGFNNNPMEFLNLFNDLDIIQGRDEKNITIFRYERGKNLMVYDEKTSSLSVNSDEIWLPLKNYFNLSRNEIMKFIELWVSENFSIDEAFATKSTMWKDSEVIENFKVRMSNMKFIITENQIEKLKLKIQEQVKRFGFEHTKKIFGEKVLLQIGFNNDPMEFLNMFNDLDVVQSGEQENWMLFRSKKGENLIIYDRKFDFVWVYISIWLTLEKDFGLYYVDAEQTIEKWLSEVYNIRNVNINKF